MNKTVTLVTAMIIDHEYNTGFSASYVDGGQTLEKVISEEKSNAMADFENNGGVSMHRIVVTVTTIPMPEDMPHIEVRGTVTDASEAVKMVTAEIS